MRYVSHPETAPGARENKALMDYERIKAKYLSLCRRHGLNPFDLDIVGVAKSRMSHRDKVAMVTMIIRLIRLERRFKGLVGRGLFPLTVAGCERSGYLVPERGNGRPGR